MTLWRYEGVYNNNNYYYYSLLRHIRQHTSTQIQKKAKIHLKYDLKYKKDMNTNIKSHSSAR